MTSSISVNDIEPLDEMERCDAAWGLYHIGRFDESRAELALMFDPRCLNPEGREARLEEFLWQALRRCNGHLHGWSTFGSPQLTSEELYRLLCYHMEPVRPFDFDPKTSLIVGVVDLPPETVSGLQQVLLEEASYVGHGSVSWPSDFRAILYSEMSYT